MENIEWKREKVSAEKRTNVVRRAPALFKHKSMMFCSLQVVQLLFILVVPASQLAGLLLIERNVENTFGTSQYF